MPIPSDLPPAVQALVEAGHRAPSADNCQPWRFYWDGKHLSVGYDSLRVSGKTFGPEEHATLLAMGAVKENIVQMADYLGVRLREVPIEASDDSQTYFKFELESPHERPPPERDHPLFHRHTNRLPYTSQPLPTEIIESIRVMSEEECRALAIVDQETIRKVGRWIQIASEARFQSRDIHEFLGRSLRFTVGEASRGDGLDVRTLALPPGGKTFLRLITDWNRLVFLNRFGLFKLLALIESSPISKAVGLVAIVGPESRNGALDAGMLMERVWVYLNRRKVGVHPYYVIADQLHRLMDGKVPEGLTDAIQKLKTETETWLAFENLTPHMLFRVGFPRAPALFSQRLPLEPLIE